MKESHKGKHCIKIAYAFCTPKVCGLMNCEHAEDVPPTLLKKIIQNRSQSTRPGLKGFPGESPKTLPKSHTEDKKVSIKTKQLRTNP